MFSVGMMVLGAGMVAGQDYPNKPIRIVVNGAPGGGGDFMSRLIAPGLTSSLGQPMIVDNRPAGVIPGEIVSKAPRDGYTLLVSTGIHWLMPFMRDAMPYDPVRDFSPVIMTNQGPNILVVHPSLAANSVKELVALAMARSGELNYASLGIGSASHLAGEVFSRALGIDAVHVPYRAAINTFAEMGLGRVHYAVMTLPAVLAPVREGRLRALAVMTPLRSSVLPEVPAIAELGMPEAQFDSWSGVVAPAGTPRRVVEQLHGDIVQALRDAGLRKRFLYQGAESMPEGTPDGFMRHMQEEYLRFQALIRKKGIKAE